jgi:hypothetical protein
MAYSMTASCSKFCRGFLQGSLLGFVLLIIGLLSWGIAILVGVEKDTSLGGFSLASLYVLSFGLGGSALVLLRNPTGTLALYCAHEADGLRPQHMENRSTR